MGWNGNVWLRIASFLLQLFRRNFPLKSLHACGNATRTALRIFVPFSGGHSRITTSRRNVFAADTLTLNPTRGSFLRYFFGARPLNARDFAVPN